MQRHHAFHTQRFIQRKLRGFPVALGCAVRIVDVEELGLPPKGDAWDWRDAHPDASAADVLALETALSIRTSATAGPFQTASRSTR